MRKRKKDEDPGKESRKLLKLTSTQAYSPILGIKDGIVVTKNREYIKLLELTPINFELRSPDEQSEIIDAFSAALRTMPDVVHLKVVNTPSDISPFIEDLISLTNSEPCLGVRNLQLDQMQLINETGKTQGVSRRFYISYEYEENDTFSRRADFESVKKVVNTTAAGIAASMEICGNTVISDDSKDYILSILYSCMCKSESRKKSFTEHKQKIISRYQEKYGNNFVEEQIPINDFIAPARIDFSVSPTYALIDGKYTMYAFIPSEAYPIRALGGWMRVLFSNFDGVDVDMWVKKENIANIQRRLSYELKINKIKEKNTEDVSQDYDDIESAISAGYYIKNAIANGEDFCYISVILTVTGDTVEEMSAKYKAIKDHLIRNDMSVRQCWFQQEEAYNATLPLAKYSESIFRKSKRNIMISQLGSCYPFTAYELNDEGGIFFGVNARYESPVFINIFDRKKYQNANMLILGPTGAGKTYTLLSMLMRMRQKNLQIYTIAPFKGTEFKRACDAVEGSFIRIAPGSAQNINIMEIRKHESAAVLVDGEEMGTTGSILTDKIQQVERFFGLLVRDMTIKESHLLDDALTKTYRRFGITEDNRSLYDPDNPGRYRDMPVLGDLQNVLKEAQGQGLNTERLVEALAKFVSGSAKSFNRATNVDLKNKFVVLDVSDMSDELLPIGMFIALDFVLDAAKADKTENKVIAIDELWRLMKASRLTAEFAVEVFKIIRGYGGSAIGATQDLADVLRDESGAAIVNNAKIKFFLPMERKEAEDVASVVDLTSEEMKQLKVSKSTKQSAQRRILMIAGANHVFISVKTSQLEHDLITTNADDLKRIAMENATKRLEQSR